MAENTLQVVIEARDLASKEFNKVNKNLGAFKVVAVAAFVELAAKAAQFTKAIANAANEGSKFADAVADMATKLGVSTEALSTLGFAASVTGGSIESMETGLRTLNRQALVAAQGSKSLVEIFTRLGVTVTDTQGTLKPTEDLLKQVADGLVNVASDSERAAIAQTIFGRAGGDLIPILNRGAVGLEDFAKRAGELGVIIDTKAAKAADLFQDTLADVRTATLGLSISLGTTLLPALQPTIAAFVGLTAELGKLISESNRGVGFVRGIGLALQFTAVVGINTFEMLTKLVIGLRTLAKITNPVTLAQQGFGNIILEAGEAIRKAEERTAGFIDAMAEGAAQSRKFNDTITNTTAANKAVAGSFAIVQTQIDKLRETQATAAIEASDAERTLAADRAERAGRFIEAEKLKGRAMIQRIEDELVAETEKLEAQAALLEKTIENETVRKEALALVQDEIDERTNAARDLKIAAAEDAAAAIVEAFESTVAPITDAITATTTAVIQGQITTAAAFKQIGGALVKTVLKQVVDAAVAEITGVQITEIGKALIKAPLSFGASLLAIAPILAAAAGAKGAINAIRLQGGGLVKGGVPGRDSVPALLEPGELVIPRGLTDFLRASLGEAREGLEFQAGGVAGGGGGMIVQGDLVIGEVSDRRQADRLLDQINDLVRTGGRELIATRLREEPA